MYEKEYRSLMLRIGFVVLAQYISFQILFSFIAIIRLAFSELTVGSGAYFIIELMSDAAYLFSFLFPAGLFYIISRRTRTERPLMDVKLTREFPIMLFASIALISAAAIINHLMLEVFNYSEYFSFNSDYSTNTQLLLAVISTAIVPAFCEEFLFRGVILTNLLPYGKTTAIITSSVLFSLMHTNGGQLFYAFVAGLALGYVYVRTRSIWGCILIHFFNNLSAVIQGMLYSRLDADTAGHISLWYDLTILLLGTAAAVILLVNETKRKKDFSGSAFGIIHDPDESYVERPIPQRAAIRHFFSPTIIVFVVLVASTVFMLILAAIIY